MLDNLTLSKHASRFRTPVYGVLDAYLGRLENDSFCELTSIWLEDEAERYYSLENLQRNGG